MGLGFLEGLREVTDRGIAVLRLGEPEFLLAGLDGVIGFNEERPGLAAKLFHGQPGERVGLNVLPARARTGPLGGLLPAVAEVEVGARAASGEDTRTDKHGAAGAGSRGDRTASAPGGVADGSGSVNGSLGKVAIATPEVGHNGVLGDVACLRVDSAGRAGREVVFAVIGHREDHVRLAHALLRGYGLRPALRVGGVFEGLGGDHIEVVLVVLQELLDGVLDLALAAAEHVAAVNDVLTGRDGQRIFGLGRSGGKRQQSGDAKNGEETLELRPHVQPFSTSATSSVEPVVSECSSAPTQVQGRRSLWRFHLILWCTHWAVHQREYATSEKR
ncbi:hypothetical protein BJG92_02921 [Arthrobacter sp. SO5]|nr:hypothetical protein [Arthrobacter sp. SO5]